MKPAPLPRERASQRLLVVSADGQSEDCQILDLPRWLESGDLVVVNDAATLPASLAGYDEHGDALELRLLAPAGRDWLAFVFGAGDYRTPTEARPLAPLAPGSLLSLGDSLRATVREKLSERLVRVGFNLDGPEFWQAIYQRGRPVQYAHTNAPVNLWSVQTAYAGRPWAVEMPSAGRPLTWELLLSLRRHGVEVRSLTHAAGLSSSGEAALDARLPLAERYEIPKVTAQAVGRVRQTHKRVIAVGTSVVRALESANRDGVVQAGPGVTELRIDRQYRLRSVNSLLTGIHDPAASHFELLHAFLPDSILREVYVKAERAGYLGHEFGDSCLLTAS